MNDYAFSANFREEMDTNPMADSSFIQAVSSHR